MILMIYEKLNLFFPSQFNFICLGITFNVMAKSGPSSNKKRTGRIRYESKKTKNYYPKLKITTKVQVDQFFSSLYAFRENMKK